MFHQHIPYNLQDLNLGTQPQKTVITNPEIAQNVLEQTGYTFEEVPETATQEFPTHEEYEGGKQSPQNQTNKIIFSLYS